MDRVKQTLLAGLDPFGYRLRAARSGNSRFVWEGLGLSTEPSRKVQGGVLHGNDLTALALGGTSRVVLRRCM